MKKFLTSLVLRLLIKLGAYEVKKHFPMGRGPARRPENLKDFDKYVAMPAAPPAAHWGHGITFGMDGNDEYGDCTIAGAAHHIPVWNREVGDKSVPVPTDAACVKQYFLLGGSPNGAPNPSLDNGLVMADVLKDWQTTGLFTGSSKIAAYAPVDPTRLDVLKQAIAFYGGAYLGVNLPESAQTQFPGPWTVVANSPIEGGHCIVAVGYDEDWCYCVSWGAIVSCSWAWIAKYLEEAWAIIPEEFVDMGRGPQKAEGLAALQADLASV